jgi:uncharacterized membrane protein
VTLLNEYSEQFHAAYWMVGLRLVIILVLAYTIGPIVAKQLRRAESDRKKIEGSLKIGDGDRIRFSTSTPGVPVFSVRNLVWFTAIIGCIVLFSVGMVRHLSFHSKAWDLAIFDQVIWNLANGNGWECSVRNVLDLRGDHFEPILYLFVPLYKIIPHVGWLLGVQALALVGTGVLLFNTYRDKIGELPSYLIFLAFCFYPPLHWLSLADFHPIALAPFFIALGWMGSRKDKLLVLIAGLIGLALCSEEGLIVAGWWGLWEFTDRGYWKFLFKNQTEAAEGQTLKAWVLLILAILFWAVFVYLAAWYIPAHRAEGEGYFYVHRYAYLGDSVSEIAVNFFIKPWLWMTHALDGRGLSLLALYLVPLALLPLRRPKVLLLLLPTALYTLLSVSPEQRSIFHQYTAIWIPFLFVAAAEAIPLTKKIAGRLVKIKKSPDLYKLELASILVTASILGFLLFSPLFGLSMHPEIFTPEDWAAEAKGIVESIGPDDAISAPSALCPHLSHRRVLLLKPNTTWPTNEELIVLPDFPPGE